MSEAFETTSIHFILQSQQKEVSHRMCFKQTPTIIKRSRVQVQQMDFNQDTLWSSDCTSWYLQAETLQEPSPITLLCWFFLVMLVANDIITTKTYADNKEIKYIQQNIIHNII